MSSQYGNTHKQLRSLLKKYERRWHEYYWNEFVLKHENKVDWCGLSCNPNITWEIMEANPDKPWDWDELSFNPNITWEIVEENPDKPWNWYGLSKNPNITWEIVEANPTKPWNWRALSSNPNITWEIVEANPDKPWDWYWLSRNPIITREIVEAKPDKPWNWLSDNPFTKKKEAFMEKLFRRHNAVFKIQTYWRRANYNPQYELCKKRLMRECEMLGIED